LKKEDFIVSIAFLRLKNTIATKKKLVAWRKHVHISGNHPHIWIVF
jgi:hypothetical protein